MANGTIAFDTLTTSDSVNTSTEKSIDTSYLFNGIAKIGFMLINMNHKILLILASSTDAGTGDIYVYSFKQMS